MREMACHANATSMPPSAMPARQSAGGKVPPGATNGDRAHHQTQPSVISVPLATPDEGGCRQAPFLPRETKIDVSKQVDKGV